MRATVDQVRTTIGEVDLSDSAITDFITTANIFVDATLLTSGLAESILTEIEKYIACHFITITRNRMAKEEGAGGAFIKYTGEFGDDLSSTPYGQTAILLDLTGTLGILDGKFKSASIKSIPQF